MSHSAEEYFLSRCALHSLWMTLALLIHDLKVSMGLSGGALDFLHFLWMMVADLSSLDSCIRLDATKDKNEITAISSGPYESKSEEDSILGKPPIWLMHSCIIVKFAFT